MVNGYGWRWCGCWALIDIIMGATTLYRLTLHYEMCWLAIGSDSNGLNCIYCLFIDECLLGRLLGWNKLADAVDNIDLTPAPYFDESRGSSWNFRGRNIFVLKASWSFLPRDAMLARYMLLSCVCLSVCLSQAGIVSKLLNTESRK